MIYSAALLYLTRVFASSRKSFASFPTSKRKSSFLSQGANKNRKGYPAILVLSVHFWEKFGQYFRGDTLPRPLSTIGVHIHRGIEVELDAGTVGIFLGGNSRAVRDD